MMMYIISVLGCLFIVYNWFLKLYKGISSTIKKVKNPVVFWLQILKQQPKQKHS